MQTVALPGAVGTSERSLTWPRPVRGRFYVGIALFMTAIVVAGFWPSYFGPLFHGNVARPWVIQLHGLVFVGWMAFVAGASGACVTRSDETAPKARHVWNRLRVSRSCHGTRRELRRAVTPSCRG